MKKQFYFFIFTCLFATQLAVLNGNSLEKVKEAHTSTTVPGKKEIILPTTHTLSLTDSTLTFVAQGKDIYIRLQKDPRNHKSPGFFFVVGGWGNSALQVETYGAHQRLLNREKIHRRPFVPVTDQKMLMTLRCLNGTFTLTGKDQAGKVHPIFTYTDKHFERTKSHGVPNTVSVKLHSWHNREAVFYGQPVIQNSLNTETKSAPTEFTITQPRTQMPHRFSLPKGKKVHLSFQAKATGDAYIHFYDSANKETYKISIGAEGRNRTIFFRNGTFAHRSADNKGLIPNGAHNFGHYTLSFDNGLIEVYAGTTAHNRQLIAQWRDSNPLALSHARFGIWNNPVTIRAVQAATGPFTHVKTAKKVSVTVPTAPVKLQENATKKEAPAFTQRLQHIAHPPKQLVKITSLYSQFEVRYLKPNQRTISENAGWKLENPQNSEKSFHGQILKSLVVGLSNTPDGPPVITFCLGHPNKNLPSFVFFNNDITTAQKVDFYNSTEKRRSYFRYEAPIIIGCSNNTVGIAKTQRGKIDTYHSFKMPPLKGEPRFISFWGEGVGNGWHSAIRMSPKHSYQPRGELLRRLRAGS